MGCNCNVSYLLWNIPYYKYKVPCAEHIHITNTDISGTDCTWQLFIITRIKEETKLKPGRVRIGLQCSIPNTREEDTLSGN